MLLEDLRSGDKSSGESGSSFLYELVAESYRLDELRTRITDGLAAKDFTIEDVAARFVGFGYVIGGPGRPSSVSFSGELFTTVTGVEARSGEDRQVGDWPDTSWARRRQFAAKFIVPTISQEDDADHDEQHLSRRHVSQVSGRRS